MNKYYHTFIAECPNNGEKVRYHLSIATENKIMVEQLMEKCAVGISFHEDIADAMYDYFGGLQTIIAYHHGVWIETTRGDA